MPQNKNTKEKFDCLAPDYDRALFASTERTSGKRFAAMTALMGATKPAGKSKILEIGAGTGIYTRLLSDFCQSQFLVSTDLSGDMLAQAVNRLGNGRVKFVQNRAEALPFLSGSFDQVFCFSCLHHIKSSNQVFAEVRRVLRSGGYFFLMEPNPLNPVNACLGLLQRHERGMLASCPNKWIREATAAGLDFVALKSGSFFPSWPKWLWPIYDKVEPALENSRLTNRLALFYFYLFQKKPE